MNTADLKNYAPQARQDFIDAVTARAAIVGLTAKHIEPITEQGDVALIGDKAFPRAVAAKRNKLEDFPHCPYQKIPSALASVAMKALSLQMDNRYQTAKELQEEIEAYQTGFATAAQEAGLLAQLILLMKFLSL